VLDVVARYLITDPNAWTTKLLAAVMTPFIKTPEQGAATNIYLASAPEVGEVAH